MMVKKVEKKAEIFGTRDNVDVASATFALMGLSVSSDKLLTGPSQSTPQLTNNREKEKQEQEKNGKNITKLYASSKEHVNLFKN